MRFECRTCNTVLTIAGNKRDIVHSPNKSPYSSAYSHPGGTSDCPLLRGYSITELRGHPEVIALEVPYGNT